MAKNLTILYMIAFATILINIFMDNYYLLLITIILCGLSAFGALFVMFATEKSENFWDSKVSYLIQFICWGGSALIWVDTLIKF